MSGYDVVVLGTGAAGLSAAISAHDFGARVAVFEKGEKVGGTSAWSGGQVWIPNNRQMGELGKADSSEEAVTYLMSMSHGLIERPMAETFVATGPEMVSFMEENTPVEFVCVKDFPDYHPEQPGGKPGGGRTLECPPYSYHELGEWAERVNVGPYWPDLHMGVYETPLCQAIPKEIPADEKARRIENDERGMGLSLVGRLLKGCLDRGILPQTNSRAVELIVDDGRVKGVRVENEGGLSEVAADSVILATGGYEWDEELCRTFLRGPLHATVAVPTNTGDGLKMAMKAGAMLGNMREAWWMPIIEVPEDFYAPGKIMFSVERGLPGSIMINRKGRRFTNEAANYNAFGAAFHEQDVNSCSYANLPCWVIFNQSFYEKYGFASYYGTELTENGTPPSWVIAGDSIADLEQALEIPGGALEQTIEQWNRNVDNQLDPDFGRGESWFDRWWGDPAFRGTKAATLGRIEPGPYYAVEVKSGALGTKGGPRTDVDGQVLSLDGFPLKGLYAVGNVMASPMGMTYGGGGGTLGPGMVFGFRAGRHAAQARTN